MGSAGLIGYVGDFAIGITLLAVGASSSAMWTRIQRGWQLGLSGHVFPINRDGRSKPKIHLRASLDKIPFGENPPTLRGYTHCGDAQGVTKIAEYFHTLPVDVEFDYFPEITGKMRNVVLLGASSRSDISREVARDLYDRNIRVRGEGEHAFFRDTDGNEYHCKHVELDGRMIVAKDVGVIFRKVTDNGTTVLMCGGIHTFGSLAAAEVALTAEFQRWINRLWEEKDALLGQMHEQYARSGPRP